MQEENKKEPAFEEALAELEQLVAKMETGKLPLEELMQNFEKGSKLVKLCRKKLEALECKIELLTKDDSNSGEWQEFHGEESNLRNAPSPLEDAPF
jgi:exodeoxyribonuclease VII small subunit